MALRRGVEPLEMHIEADLLYVQECSHIARVVIVIPRPESFFALSELKC